MIRNLTRDPDARAGILLIFAALLALIASNTPWVDLYNRLLSAEVAVRFDQWSLAKPLLLWINDGLMAVFFLFVGLEIKREVLNGSLSSVRRAALPAAAALGGMLAPALIYLAINYSDATARHGWAIPTATDIAFALGVLALLGSRVPATLKVLLSAVAVIDDLGAIVIIAMFYTDHLSLSMLAAAAAGIAGLLALNLAGVRNIGAYLLVGIVVWIAVLKSGVHATLAGVAVAMFIPATASSSSAHGHAPLETLEHALKPWVIYAIVPVFAFANAGVALTGIEWSTFPGAVALGIAAGLVAGKTIGVFAVSWLTVKMGVAELPEGVSWPMLLGMALLCGIGFTMSLFIGTLAFEQNMGTYAAALRIGVLGGSLCAGVLGMLLLRHSTKSV